jgi:hypothetical protein
MKGFAGLAVTGTMLVLAMPAMARDRSGMEGGEAKRLSPVVAPSRHLPLVSQSIAIDSRGVVPTVDPAAPRLLRSLPVAENVDLGVGLFSVVGITEKEQVRRRLDPVRAMQGRSDTRVAAVGMSLRF